MKLVEEEKILPNCGGTVMIVPEETDDLWLLYNLFSDGDVIVADTSRKTSGAEARTTQKNPTKRVRFAIEMKITAIDYDQVASVIRVSGRNLVPNEWITAGVFHSVEIERNTKFSLKKKAWDSDSIEQLRIRANSAKPDLAVLLVQEASADLYLIGKVAATLCCKIQATSNSENTSSKTKSRSSKFFESILNAFVKHIDFDLVKLVAIAVSSPVGNQFWQYLRTESRKQKFSQVEENKDRLVMVNTPGKTNLNAVLHEPEMIKLIRGTSCAVEIKAWDDLTDMMRKDWNRTCYGLKSVKKANQLMAIDALYVSYELYHSENNAIRREYTDLVKSVKKTDGKVMIYSSNHVMGEQLHQLTGIAAILRYPLPDLDDMEL